MTELKEIFEMVTQETEPDVESWQEQQTRQRRAARGRKLAALAVVAGIIIAAALAFTTLRTGMEGVPGDTPTPPPPVGMTTHFLVDVRTGDRTPVPAVMPGGRLLSVSPDGTLIAYNTCCSNDAIWIANFDGSGERRITPDGLDSYGAAWTPDGGSVVFQGRDPGTSEIGQLYRVDVETGDLAQITHFGHRTSGAWITVSTVSPDGDTVLFHLVRGRAVTGGTWDLWTVPIAGGEPTLLRKNAGFPSYGADGSIAYIDRPSEFMGKSIWVMNADGSDARPVVQGGLYEWPRISPDGTAIAYGDDETGHVMVTDIGTGNTTDLGLGTQASWTDGATLIVG